MLDVAYFYWGGEKMSFMRAFSISSFCKMNPNWKVILYKPSYLCVMKTWSGSEYKAIPEYADAESYLYGINNLEIKKIDFRDIGFENQVSEAYKSDYLQWWLLANKGGLFSDTDIVYFKPAIQGRTQFNYIYHRRVYYIPYMQCVKGCKAATTLLSAAQSTPCDGYQSLGNALMSKVYPSEGQIPDGFNFTPDIVLPIRQISKLDTIYDTSNINISNSIGIHWYGGHETSTKWENTITHSNYNIQPGNIFQLMRGVGI